MMVNAVLLLRKEVCLHHENELYIDLTIGGSGRFWEYLQFRQNFVNGHSSHRIDAPEGRPRITAQCRGQFLKGYAC